LGTYPFILIFAAITFPWARVIVSEDERLFLAAPQCGVPTKEDLKTAMICTKLLSKALWT